MFRKFFWLLLGPGLLAVPTLWASEARVSAAGGLSLVMEDEVYDINPFVLGDPAGLAFLPPKERLDLSGEYFYENDAADQFERHYAGTLGNMADDTVNYKGLILFPTDRWGVQLNGDYLYTEGQAESNFNSIGNNRVRGLLRTAYRFGPFALGAELAPSQTTSPLAGQPLGTSEITSGSDTSTAWGVNGGLLACFPSDPGPHQDRFEIGGIYGNQLTAPQDTVDLNIIPNGSLASSPLTAIVTESTDQTIGPEAYFESPGTFQAAVITRFIQVTSNLQLSSPNILLVPQTLNYKADDTSAAVLAAVFKSATPLDGGLNWRNGGLVTLSNSTQNSYDPSGAPVSTLNQQNLEAQVGTGVEKPGDFTVGLQASLQTVSGTDKDSLGNGLGDTGYLVYSFSMGGERWITKQWAFRMGLAYQNQFNSGNVPYSTFYLPAMDPGVRLITTIITVGAGFKDEGFYGDWEFSYGQPTRYGGDPSAFATQVGTQLALGVAFN
jgi:hypothetical protein